MKSNFLLCLIALSCWYSFHGTLIFCNIDHIYDVHFTVNQAQQEMNSLQVEIDRSAGDIGGYKRKMEDITKVC